MYIHVYIHVHISTYRRKEEKGGKEKRGSKCLKRRWLVGPTIFTETHIHSFAREHYVCMDMYTRARVCPVSLCLLFVHVYVSGYRVCLSVFLQVCVRVHATHTQPTPASVIHLVQGGGKQGGVV